LFYTKKERIELFLKCMVFILVIGLLFDFVFGNGEHHVLNKLAIAFGCSLGISLNDLMFGRKFSNIMKIIKSNNSSVQDTEKNKISSYSYLSIIMGAIGIPSFPLVLISVLGLFYGLVGLKSSKKTIAKVGIGLSSIGIIIALLFYIDLIYINFY
jgi:hypothetical protein